MQSAGFVRFRGYFAVFFANARASSRWAAMSFPLAQKVSSATGIPVRQVDVYIDSMIMD